MAGDGLEFGKLERFPNGVDVDGPIYRFKNILFVPEVSEN